MAAKTWDKTIPANSRFKYLIPGDIRDIKEHVQVSGGLYAEAQGTPNRTFSVYAGVIYFGITKVEYAGNDGVDFGPGGAYQLTALTAHWYNKILMTITSAGVLTKYEGTQAATAGAVTPPAIPSGEFPICLITVQDDGTGTSGTIIAIVQADIQQLQGVMQPVYIHPLPIVDGGTGQNTAQLAINALSAVAGATNEHVLTKDTGSGNAIFKAASGIPTGGYLNWPTESVPAGFLECDGSSLDRTTYAGLFAVLGTLYGTVDGSHFNLPDWRGRFPRAWAHGSANDPDRATRTKCGKAGSTMTAGDHVGTEQVDGFEAHVHSVSETANAWGDYAYPAGGDGAATGSTNTGSIGGNETRPINEYAMICIKY